VKVNWTRPALRELDALSDYIARDNPLAALRIVQRIREQTGHLAEVPHIGREGRVPNTRELVVTHTPYIVVYRVHDERIDVLSVIHGARKWPGRFG